MSAVQKAISAMSTCPPVRLFCRMWDFGLEQAITKFLDDPVLRENMKNKEHRTIDDPASFYGSPQFQQLDQDCAGALTSNNVLTMLIGIGGDGVQLLNWGNRTATVVALKCEDQPPHIVQTGRAVAPLFVIEGPTEPSELNHVFRSTVDKLIQYAPSSDGTGVLPMQLCRPSTNVISIYCS